MLGKLLKHEFKETARLIIPLNLILIGLTCIGAILLGTRIFQNDSFAILAASSMTLYILSIFAIFIVSIVFFTIRFYKTMYSSQGYLTHTLPVSTGSIINTKILISAFWTFITSIITVLSVFLLIRVTAGNDWDPVVFSNAKAEFINAFGFSFNEFLVYLIILVIISCFAGIIKIYASLSVGQLFLQHRILAAVGAYVIFYVIEQVISTILMFVLGLNIITTVDVTENIDSSAVAFVYRNLLLSSIIESLVLTIIFYIACHYITRKKLNLE